MSLILFSRSAIAKNISTPSCPKSFSCSGLGPFKYPFYYNTTDTKCGLIKINCTAKGGELQFGGRSYEIVAKYDIDRKSYNIVIRNETFDLLMEKNTCEALTNTFIFPSPNPLLYSISISPFITLFKCAKNNIYFEQHKYNSYNKCKDHNFYYNYFNGTVPSDLPRTCQVLQLPMKMLSAGLDETNITSFISSNPSIFFKLTPLCDECHQNGGQCGAINGRAQCLEEKPGAERTLGHNVVLAFSVMALALGGSIAVSFFTNLCISLTGRKKNTKYNANLELFLKNQEFLAPKRYSYSQVEKMTSSFKVKLGQGGFGAVYKGVLESQNLVAVKVLSEGKSDGEDFINEVASVSGTSHVNIVNLVGFCLEDHQRALIYEYMPNGSLERFIYSRGSSSSNQLGWEKLYQIAIGIARGLEYLHTGCNTRIVHFDIKPHNILLDGDFCPKISDFGLAKLSREEKSKISMSHVRGTPGYIAPELFSRNFGEISYKSDVYSYGMMILEMVGGRKDFEVGVDHTSDVYFPRWIYKKATLHEEQLGLHEIENNEESRIARKMIIVGLWCIQTNPLDRPGITRVLEMLEGDLGSLKIPPKPYMFSPTSRSLSSPSTN